ncbi:MAG: class I SAM-dependent methyltransferase family protein [Candidatus Aenigmarchaeota archaeon]|nr:class I SAM-dependent methyltransferase family protein [Candidatus Aenigmarchaeota archaeon]
MKPKNLKEALSGKISKEEIKTITKSFDTIGSIAIIEVPEEHGKNKIVLADAIMSVNKSIKTVLMKCGEREGEFRLRNYEYLAGEKTFETIHREHGCSFYVDVRKAYFSPRESTERQHIADAVSSSERVLVMFAGIGPFAIVIAKKARANVTAVEINPEAVKLMEKNIRLNKTSVVTVLGDVAEVCKGMVADRILMPLPKHADKFLDLAVGCIAKNGVIHYYTVSGDDTKKAENEVLEAAKRAGRGVKILAARKVLPYSPRLWKICIDAEFK